jgi:hypothetical protein
MKRVMWILGAVLAAGCSEEGGGTVLDLSSQPSADLATGGSTGGQGGADGGTTPTPPTVVEVSGEITGDTTWTADKIYELTDKVFVRGATLTIQPGTTVRGRTGTALFITNTAKISAVGTATQPIVFTSAKAVGSRAPKDWGGLILLGKARINLASPTTIFEALPNDTRGEYGGSDDAHDCGKVKYVRIEFGGFPFQQDKEYNNLTMGACGSATEVDYVQVHKGADDGIEIFGGTVDVKHAVITQNEDDGLDWDFGWTGRAQWLIVQHSAAAGNHGFECDNNPSNNAATPRSSPRLYNVTYVGSNGATKTKTDKELVAIFRTGTEAEFGNSLFLKAATFPIDVANKTTVENAKAGKVTISHSIFFDNAKQSAWNDTGMMCDTAPGTAGRSGDCSERACTMGTESTCSDASLDLDEGAHFLATANNNLSSDPQLSDPTNLTAPNFKPATTSPALVATNAKTPPSGFDPAPYLGAIGATDWTTGWTAYPAN